MAAVNKSGESSGFVCVALSEPSKSKIGAVGLMHNSSGKLVIKLSHAENSRACLF